MDTPMTHDHPPPRTPSSGPGDDSIDAQQPTRPNRRWPSVPGYQIISELGQGGMGIVYKARQSGLNRLVALKMIRPGMPVTPRKLARFLTEAQAIATLQHPNVVQIFEIGELDGLPYYAMEYVPGSTLADVPPNRKMDVVAAARFMETLAYAIAAIHGQGIVHRDLKPSNILLTADGTPKITDFGLARRLNDSERLTGDGEILGTPSYMAPEQVCGDVDAIGPACDLYALGAIFYLLLTGKAPFTGESVSVLFATVNTPPEPPRVFAPDVPAVLENLCLKCLEKDPARRPADADEIIDTLQRFLRSNPQAFHETHSSRADEAGARRSGGQTLNLGRKKRSAARASKKHSRHRTRQRRKAPAASGRWWQVGVALFLLAGLGVGLWWQLMPKPGVQGDKNETRTPQPEPLVYLSALTPSDSENWQKEPPRPRDGRPPPAFLLGFEGKESPHGIFMHPPPLPNGGRSRLSYRLDGQFNRFQATVGLNQHGPHRSETPVTFSVLLDGKPFWKSVPISFRGEKDSCALDVSGVNVLTLEVDCAGFPGGAHALWVEPHLVR